jgi:hypothetical protein
MAIDFNKLLADMAFKQSLPVEPFRVMLTQEQARHREAYLSKFRLDWADYIDAKKLHEQIRDAFDYAKQQNPDKRLELEIEVEPFQCYAFACGEGGGWTAWGTSYPAHDRRQKGNVFLFQCDAKFWPRDQAEFEKACRHYGIKSPEKLAWIPF